MTKTTDGEVLLIPEVLEMRSISSLPSPSGKKEKKMNVSKGNTEKNGIKEHLKRSVYPSNIFTKSQIHLPTYAKFF